MRQERPATPFVRPDFHTLMPFLRETQARYVHKHGKQRPDVPIVSAGAILKPFYDLSTTTGFDLLDSSSEEAEGIRQKIIDALVKPYGRTDNTRARPIFRPLYHESTLFDKVDGIGMTELVGIAGNTLGNLGDANLEEALVARLNPLVSLVHRAVAATLPNESQENAERWARLNRLQNAFTAWTMAIVYATAYATAVDDHEGFVLFAPLARLQLRTFLTGIDPYSEGRIVIAYTHC